MKAGIERFIRFVGSLMLSREDIKDMLLTGTASALGIVLAGSFMIGVFEVADFLTQDLELPAFVGNGFMLIVPILGIWATIYPYTLINNSTPCSQES